MDHAQDQLGVRGKGDSFRQRRIEKRLHPQWIAECQAMLLAPIPDYTGKIAAKMAPEVFAPTAISG